MEFTEYIILSFIYVGLAMDSSVNCALIGSINARILEKYKLEEGNSVDTYFSDSRQESLVKNSAVNIGVASSKRNMLRSNSIDGRGAFKMIPNSFHHIYKRQTSSRLKEDNQISKTIKMLLATDSKLAVLDFIERMLKNHSSKNCNNLYKIQSIEKIINNTIDDSFYSQFKLQMVAAMRTSNFLNILFKTKLKHDSNTTLYVEDFYYALARSLVESNSTVYGTAIVFEGKQYLNKTEQSYFAPFVYRNGTNPEKIVETDLAKTASLYAKLYTSSSEARYDWIWFKNTRNKSNEFNKNELCKGNASAQAPVLKSPEYGSWLGPSFTCDEGMPKLWIMSYSVPFFGCRLGSTKNDAYNLKGVVNVKIDLSKVDINQCSNDTTHPFADTHRCNRTSTECVHESGRGFRRGSYKCVCKLGYYLNKSVVNGHNQDFFKGQDVEESYVEYILNQSHLYQTDFYCLPCARGCKNCSSSSPCYAEYDIIIRGVPLGITSFCMTIALVISYSLVRLRKSKVMKASFWLLLEIFIFGALLLYSTILIQFFKPTNFTCLLIPWFREVGFAIVYGALVLKVYRVLAEFQSRKAHRVHVRDKDLLKWLFGIVIVIIGYMSAWTALNSDHIRDGKSMLAIGETPEGLNYNICKSSWWDVLTELGEFLYLLFGIYLCYCIRSAPSDYLETRYISWAIYNETLVSAIIHIARHILWLFTNPDYIYLMYFIRCQLTVTVNLALVLGPKIYYSHRPPEDEAYRNRAYSTSDVQDNILPESVKLHVGVNSNGDVDVGEINLSEMDPEDIRTELKRLYTQLQIYKTKTMRKDNPHISKRRGGRKHTHRRFSLQAFHHKHRHHHHHHPSASEVSMDHDTEMSRTPEESTNSNEGYGYSIDESSVVEARTPTVTFKPGHKTIY